MLAIAGLVVGGSITVKFLIPASPRERLHALRIELTRLRSVADSCLEAVSEEEDTFRSLNTRLDSLRGRIDTLESLDVRGVPADSYDTYIEAFRRYNRGVPTWQPAADSLQAHWRACRALVQQHNVLADSARRLAEQLDLIRPEG